MLLRVYTILLITVLFQVPYSLANQPSDKHSPLVFHTREVKGERLSEDDPPKTYTFTFRNMGSKPLLITRVNTSCGCAVAGFDEKAVAPGKEGTVTISYNPKDHPGKFFQYAYVYTADSDTRPAARLTISGEVTPTANKWRDYPVAMGPLRVKRNFMMFREVTRKTTQIERLECANSGNHPLRVGAMAGLMPVWLTFRTDPGIIQPGEIADLIVEVNGQLLPPGLTEKLEYSLVLDGLTVRPSQRSLKIIVIPK